MAQKRVAGWKLLAVASMATNVLSEEEFVAADRERLYADLLLQLRARVEEIIPPEHEHDVIVGALKAEMRLAERPQLSHVVTEHLVSRFSPEAADQILVDMGGEWRIVEMHGEGTCRIPLCPHQHGDSFMVIMHNLLADAIESMRATDNPAEQERINAEAWRKLLASRFGPAVARDREEHVRKLMRRIMGPFASIFGGSLEDAMYDMGFEAVGFGGPRPDLVEQIFRGPGFRLASSAEVAWSEDQPAEGCTCGHAGKCEACRPRLRQLAKQCGCGRCQVCALLKQLEPNGSTTSADEQAEASSEPEPLEFDQSEIAGGPKLEDEHYGDPEAFDAKDESGN